jgi:hypothetical protein
MLTSAVYNSSKFVLAKYIEATWLARKNIKIVKYSSLYLSQTFFIQYFDFIIGYAHASIKNIITAAMFEIMPSRLPAVNSEKIKVDKAMVILFALKITVAKRKATANGATRLLTFAKDKTNKASTQSTLNPNILSIRIFCARVIFK